MTTPTTNELFHSAVVVLTGTAGLAADTASGYIAEESAVESSFLLNTEMLRMQGENLAVAVLSRAQEVSVAVPVSQINKAQIELASGKSFDGEIVTFGEPTTDPRMPMFSAAVVGNDINGTSWRLDLPYASQTEDVILSQSQIETTELAMKFTGLGGQGLYPTLTRGAGNVEGTLDASGILTRTTGIMRVRSNVLGAADTLTDIIGTGPLPLLNGERLTLVISRANEPITLEEASGVVENFSGVDHILNDVTQLVTYAYDLPGTTWDMVSRIDAT